MDTDHQRPGERETMRRKEWNEMKRREHCKWGEKGDIDYRTGIRETSNGERGAMEGQGREGGGE